LNTNDHSQKSGKNHLLAGKVVDKTKSGTVTADLAPFNIIILNNYILTLSTLTSVSIKITHVKN